MLLADRPAAQPYIAVDGPISPIIAILSQATMAVTGISQGNW